MSEINVIVGPPCAGKSTYALRSMNDGDVIIDYDAIAVAIGSNSPHDATGSVRKVALLMRWRAVNEILRSIDHGAWIVHTKPTESVLARYKEAGAIFTVLDPGKDVCLQRAKDAERGPLCEQVITEWYDDPPAVPESKALNFLPGLQPMLQSEMTGRQCG